MLKVQGLNAGYGSIKVLHDISLEVAEDEMVAVIGANGAGKTTLLKTISGLVRAASGTITFEGRDITHLAPEKIVRAGISHVPEGRRVFARATVMTNLEMGAFIRKDKDGVSRDIQKFLELFPILGERHHQIAGTLSGGEQQMLAMARGLMNQPKLLLLDEPSMGLAPFLVNEIMKITKQLHSEGTPVMLIEQNVHKALKISQRAYVIELGRIVYQDQARALLESDVIRKSYLGEN